MTLEEAIQQLNKGSKIRHRLFSPYEFIYKKDGKLYDELEIELSEKEFWQYRNTPPFEKDWAIIE